jgi:hypothetical protein
MRCTCPSEVAFNIYTNSKTSWQAEKCLVPLSFLHTQRQMANKIDYLRRGNNTHMRNKCT